MATFVIKKNNQFRGPTVVNFHKLFYPWLVYSFSFRRTHQPSVVLLTLIPSDFSIPISPFSTAMNTDLKCSTSVLCRAILWPKSSIVADSKKYRTFYIKFKVEKGTSVKIPNSFAKNATYLIHYILVLKIKIQNMQ